MKGDGTVDASDLSELSNAYCSTPGDPKCDLNGDGKVTIQDLYIVSKNYGKTAV